MILSKPTQFNEFIINKKFVDILTTFNIDNLQNIVLYGKKNIGKKTLVQAFINHLFTQNNIFTQKITKNFKYHNKSYTCVYTTSHYYYEIDFLENVKHIKKIIMDFLLNLCTNVTLHIKYRIIILHNIDVVREKNLNALLYLIETFYKYNKFIIISNNSSLHLFNSKLMNMCFNVRCYLDKQELNNYIQTKKYTKKVIDKIRNCNDLYEIMLLTNYKALTQYQPINTFLEKIHKLLVKMTDLLCITKLKSYIQDMHLLNFDLKKIPIAYIKFIRNKKNMSDSDLHLLYHIANKYNPNKQTFELFSFIETFFIEVKLHNLL